MPETYTHLTEDEQYQIYEGIVHGLSHRVIAKYLNRHNSNVSRKATRNKGKRVNQDQSN
jgi:IS30 family transposase